MTDDRLERLLRGYRPPDVPPHLDRRVLADAERILFLSPMRAGSLQFLRHAMDALGFGYLSWLYDFVRADGAEYRVEIL
jgi:hypothetical protein